jgi:hypothetical protein
METETPLETIARLTAERDRLQHILNSRPAINAGLPETYITWSQGIYMLDFIAVRGETLQ